jgi:hypothetical protein
MVAVVTPGISAEMWLPAAHFAVGGAHSRSTQPIFQTTSLVAPEGFGPHGR